MFNTVSCAIYNTDIIASSFKPVQRRFPLKGNEREPKSRKGPGESWNNPRNLRQSVLLMFGVQSGPLLLLDRMFEQARRPYLTMARNHFQYCHIHSPPP